MLINHFIKQSIHKVGKKTILNEKNINDKTGEITGKYSSQYAHIDETMKEVL